MKKYTIGIGVAIVFVVYSMVLRNQHSAPVIAPSSLSNKSSASKASSNASSTSSSGSTSNTSSGSGSTTSAQYKNGTYTGSVENAYYGNVQVSATVSGGKITSVNFVQYPNDNPNSQSINQQAMPYLQQEAIQAQGSNVSVISGATFTSQAFIQSLASALSQAKA